MKRLLCVPIIHDEADLGSAGAELAKKSILLSGENRWASHQGVVSRFWKNVRELLISLDPARLKLYQDGLAVGGETARKIIEEAAGRGSRNYRLVEEMILLGAQVRKTEDPALLLRERENLLTSMRRRPAGAGRGHPAQYQQQRDRLMEERDNFIAENILTTLMEGELGVLFIGAKHRVMPRLTDHISVEAVVDPETVQAYFQELFFGDNDGRLDELGRSLTSPFSAPQSWVTSD
ncbi:MAG: hypothetical protein ACE5JL_09735 [Dehalococcoidia bacterium]